MTINEILQSQADSRPNSPAILGLDQVPLTYYDLYRQTQTVIEQLRSFGLSRNDPIAVVLPDGPEMAVAFLSIAGAATFAPLNPAYREPEFEFYLSDLNAKALIVRKDTHCPAVGVAQTLGIPVIELFPVADGPSGLFTLTGRQQLSQAEPEPVQPEDVVLVLHTSGTTSRPKIVPLTHRNMCVSAANIAQTVKLTPDDRSLAVMPMFHIHVLVASILAAITSGGSIVCPPGFNAPYFLDWLDSFQPTWYSGGPAIHQSVLARAGEDPKRAARSSLRLIRSCSAPVPPSMMAALENAFNVPLIEVYGMTEAAQQITSNPLPPGLRKPGSVGLPAGPEVAIMAEDTDDLLPSGKTGEVVIRGENVISGYANNPEANAKSFTKGWFRTGDQGYFDSDGYLHLTGRIKEIINRGGEKVSPLEVDAALLKHPAVVEAITFAMPDTTLGEEVAAAVVLQDSEVDEQELRRFIALQLAHFKVPQRIVKVDKIPRGPTGKVQRVKLAETFGLTGHDELEVGDENRFVAPTTEVQKILAGLWCEVLRTPEVGIHQRFLNLGGDSLLATRLVARIRKAWDVEVSLFDFFNAPTIAKQAEIIEDRLR